MGHCEMLLAVAGLDQIAIAERSRRLADGDWSQFSQAEQAAFRFTRKQASRPAAITEDDVADLVHHFGQDRALELLVWTSRCHYQTRIADAFQLPLERDNVLDGFAPSKEPPPTVKP
jgi:alkylhydroperoxidase family enzyme